MFREFFNGLVGIRANELGTMRRELHRMRKQK